MRRLPFRTSVLSLLLVPLALAAKPAPAGAYGALPVAFESNEGQTDPAVRFLARTGALTTFFTEDGVTLRVAKAKTRSEALVFRLSFAGRSNASSPYGLGELAGKVNYIDLLKPEKGHAGVPLFTRVKYASLYSGVDLEFYGAGGAIEHDFLLAPGADPRVIALDVHGADSLELGRDGRLFLCAGRGELALSAPVAYQEGPHGRVAVDARFVLRGDRRIGFDVAAYDRTRPLVIDPSFLYSTYLGGNGDDTGDGIAIDASGNAYITGSTTSTNFPTVAGSLQTSDMDGTGTDGYVSKLNATGTALVYSTYIGAAGTQISNGIAVDSTGRAYVVGFTSASSADGDAYIVRLNAAGSSASPANGGYVTVFGGATGQDVGYGVAVDASFNAFVTGQTEATNFPVTAGAYQTSFMGANTAGFFTRFDASGNLNYATFLIANTSSDNQGASIAVDASGSVYVAGYHFFYCANFPNCTGDALVGRFTPNGANYNAAYFGTITASNEDRADAVVTDGSGNAYVVGTTKSTDFPTMNPLQGTNGGGNDAFFIKLGPTGNDLYSTYLGGTADQFGTGVALDGSGNVFISGESAQVDPNGDAFVVRLIKQMNGTYLLAGGYSLTFGGSLLDMANKVVADSSGNAYVVGSTNSSNLPVTAARFQGAKGDADSGLRDAFVAKLSPTAPQISIGDASLTEPNTGAANMPFTVSVDHPSSATITVVANTVNGTATAGSDYTALSNVTVTIPPMQTSVTLNVSILGDTTCETNETFTVNLSSPSANATILDSQATGTINNNDADPTAPTVTAPAAVVVTQSKCN